MSMSYSAPHFAGGIGVVTARMRSRSSSGSVSVFAPGEAGRVMYEEEGSCRDSSCVQVAHSLYSETDIFLRELPVVSGPAHERQGGDTPHAP